MNRQILEQDGFGGFVTVGQLKKKIDVVPKEKGVYAVLYTKETEPEFLQRGTGGFFKGEDPNVPISTLKAKWVEGAEDNTVSVFILERGILHCLTTKQNIFLLI